MQITNTHIGLENLLRERCGHLSLNKFSSPICVFVICIKKML